MDELLRNFGLSSNSTFGGGGEYFGGDVVSIKNIQLRLDELISEGGFGYVYKARDLKTLKTYAVKRMISSDEESQKEIENEISMLERVQYHRHIMEFFGYDIVKPNIYYLLCEFCGSGTLNSIQLPITNKPQMNRIIYQIALAIERLHGLSIIHRDIKIENILFDDNGFIKLCDFGSATDKSYKPNHNWSPIQRSLLEDEMNRHTTPMYRPPEILDTYLHYEINTSMDIWAFGCLIFFIRFGQHPFEDSSKLRIINCKYNIPEAINHNDTIIEIIRHCLQVNPSDRINASNIIKRMEENFVDLNSPCVIPKTLQAPSPTIASQPTINSSNTASNVPGIAQSYFAGFTRYIKDTSNRVIQTVQSSIARQDLDMTFLTSRFVVMSYPAQGLESAYRNHIDDVRAVLEARETTYLVINVSGRSYDSTKFGPNVKVIDGGVFWEDPKKVAPISSIISLCEHIYKWMNENNRNTIVIHCMDGKNNSAMLTISFLILIELFGQNGWEKALDFFVTKRNRLELTASHRRYLQYLSLYKQLYYKDYKFYAEKKVILKSIKMVGIPLINKLRDGCRPYLELYTNLNSKIYSTYTDYEKLIPYSKDINDCVLWSNIDKTIDLESDLLLIIAHARSTLGSKMLNQAKMISIRIASLQCNLLFETDFSTCLPYKVVFNLIDLNDIEELDRYPFDFKIEIEYDIKNVKSPVYNTQNFDILRNANSKSVFVDEREYDEFIELHNPIRKQESRSYSQNYFNEPIQSATSSPSMPTKFKEVNSMVNNVELIDADAFPLKNKTVKDNTDLLLNLSFDESTTTTNNILEGNLLGADLTPDIDLLSDGFNSKLTTDDLLGINQSSTYTNSISDSLKPTIIGDKIPLSSKMIGKNLSKNPSTPNLAARLDPLGDLDDILNISIANKNKQSNSSIPRVSSFNAFPQDSKSSNSTNRNNQNSLPSQPDYSRHNFEDIAARAGIKAPRVIGNEFEDLLSGFKKSNPENNSNKTIAQIRKEEMLKRGADPNSLKVNEWKENKEKNIRALLCSLHEVVWEGCRWNPIGMHQLLTPDDVKQMYRKACLAVHPDRLVDSPHEKLAKYIFMELNDAWVEFSKDPKK